MQVESLFTPYISTRQSDLGKSVKATANSPSGGPDWPLPHSLINELQQQWALITRGRLPSCWSLLIRLWDDDAKSALFVLAEQDEANRAHEAPRRFVQ